MSELSSCLTEYLALRRSLGYKLYRAGQVLTDFVAYLDAQGVSHIRIDLALAWATRSPEAGPGWRATRLGAVRCFARYAQALDPSHEVPPVWLLPGGRRRPAPYVYSEAEIAGLMRAARGLRSPLRAATLETIIGLLAVSGIRVGEAIRLDRNDVEMERRILNVRNSKAGKSREVPLQVSTIRALGVYAARCDEVYPSPGSPALFVSTAGTRLGSSNLGMAFYEVLEQAGLSRREGRSGPRLADMRHTFAVRTLTSWHRQGLDVEAMLPVLSTYMGHVSPTSTYWYFSASPELLGAAARRLEGMRGGGR